MAPVAAVMKSGVLDPLTGLPDREVFDLYLRAIDALAQRNDRPYCVIQFDLDGLGRLARMSRTAGRDALRTFADVVRGTLRTEDVAAWRGDGQFIALLPETELAGAVNAAERILEGVVAQSILQHGGVLNADAGIARWRSPRTAQGVCDRASELLAIAKAKELRGAIAAEGSEPTAAPR